VGPSPSPIVVELVTGNETPWWAGSLLTGTFVVFAALIAFLSLRASDKRKLAREDRRQWDLLIKDGYISISTSIERLFELERILPQAEDSEDFDSVLDSARAILGDLRTRAAEWELIAPIQMQNSLQRVRAASRNLYNRMRRGDSTVAEHDQLVFARTALRDEAKNGLRIATKKAPRRQSARMIRWRFATFFSRFFDRLRGRRYVLDEDTDQPH
jgi:hypothetical protein